MAGKDIETIKQKSEQAARVLQEIGTAAYQAAQAQQASQTQQTQETGKEGEKVVDADYKVVDEDKK